MKEYNVYIGTWSDSIFRLSWNPDLRSLCITGRMDATNPSYLAMSQDNKILYATCEVDKLDDITGGGLYAFDLGDNKAARQLLSTGGGSPCHIGLQGDRLIVSNYGDGSLAVFPLNNGRPETYRQLIRHKGHGKNTARQEGPHMHCAMPVPHDRDLFCAVDLGLDTLTFYRNSELGFAAFQTVRFPPGSGPRHVVFSQDGHSAWAVTELSSEVYSLTEKDGQWQIADCVSALPSEYSGESTCAAIHLSMDEKSVCVSNRGHDSIACFSPDLKLQWIQPSGGRTPRDFAFTPDDKWLIVANQDSDNITVLSANDGLQISDLSLHIHKPTCVLF